MVDARDLDLAEAMRAAVGTFARRTRQGSGTASDARVDILGQLERSDRPLSAAMLARLRGVAHQSARAQLAGMAADGLVAGAPDTRDGSPRRPRRPLHADGFGAGGPTTVTGRAQRMAGGGMDRTAEPRRTSGAPDCDPGDETTGPRRGPDLISPSNRVMAQRPCVARIYLTQ